MSNATLSYQMAEDKVRFFANAAKFVVLKPSHDQTNDIATFVRRSWYPDAFKNSWDRLIAAKGKER